MTVKVGVVFASTGGHKLVRAVKTFRAIEPGLPVHVTLDVGTRSYQMLGEPGFGELDCLIHRFHSSNSVNGGLNEATRLMRDMGFDAVCLFHDDIIFSPLPEHRHSVSCWFDQDWEKVSGITFAHLEMLTSEEGLRRQPLRWDREDLSDPDLWHELMGFDRRHNGSKVYPSGRDWHVNYEGSDKYRKWNRLGPTGQVYPVRLWEEFGGFDEATGVIYDIDYPAEVLVRKLPPVYAVPNIPWLHLHNQSVNPWADPLTGIWSDPLGNFQRKFGATITDFWWGNWEERWW